MLFGCRWPNGLNPFVILGWFIDNWVCCVTGSGFVGQHTFSWWSFLAVSERVSMESSLSRYGSSPGTHARVWREWSVMGVPSRRNDRRYRH